MGLGVPADADLQVRWVGPPPADSFRDLLACPRRVQEAVDRYRRDFSARACTYSVYP